MKRLIVPTGLLIALFITSTVFAAGQGHQMSSSSGMSMGMAKASEILGKNLVNHQDEELGEVQDLIVGENGKISHLIISRGGVLGLGEDLIPIPWSAARANFQGDKIVLNINKEKLQQAPSFQAGNWEEFFSEGRQEEIRGYYGESENYGTEKSSGTMKKRSGSSSEMETHQKQQDKSKTE